jgi:hypothetical protein
MARITERIIELLETLNATALTASQAADRIRDADYSSDRFVEGVLGGAEGNRAP